MRKNLHAVMLFFFLLLPTTIYCSQTNFQNKSKVASARGLEFQQKHNFSSKRNTKNIYIKINNQSTSHVDDLISIDLQNINTRDLLKIFADFTKKNFIISDKIRGKLSIKLHNVSWQDALNTILKTQGLSKEESDNIILIAPQADVERYSNQSTSSPHLINIQQTSADNIATILEKQTNLTNNSNISIDKNHNSLIINSNSPEQLAAITGITKALDKPNKQVLIEGKIINADDKVTKDLGLKFSSTTLSASNSNNSANMDLPLAVTDPGHFGIALAKLGDGVILNMELSALENAGHIKIISSPKLITTNNQPAYIESGEEIPYQEKTSSGATNIAFKKAVLSLKTTPQIIAANKLILHLQLNQDKVSDVSINGVPAIQTQQMQTQVTLNSGETIVLGGIYEYTTIENVMRIPVLGAIPLIGYFFRNKHKQTIRSELLIFITPKII